MNTRWKFKLYFVIAGVFINLTSLAFEMPSPAESLDSYNLIAKVVIKSIDLQREVQYFDSSGIQAFGHPVVMEVIDPLIISSRTNELTVLAQAYGFNHGRRYVHPQVFTGYIVQSNALTIACRYFDNTNWLVIAEILSEEMWEIYRKQKETGVIEKKISEEAESNQVIREQLLANQKKLALYEQLRQGQITEEEFQKQMEALKTITNRTILITD